MDAWMCRLRAEPSLVGAVDSWVACTLREWLDGYTQIMEIDAGTVIDERFTIISPLGSGGMGSVFLAQQSGLDRQIAVKVLEIPSRSEATERRKRFEREAQFLTQLSHKNIVSF